MAYSRGELKGSYDRSFVLISELELNARSHNRLILAVIAD
jgi:hypothetical protein